MSNDDMIRQRIGQPLPEANLQAIAKVTQDDLQQARKLWMNDVPPFAKRLLDAKTVDTNK